MAELAGLRVVVAMPAYNEEKYIGTMVLKAKKYTSEVVVVDDGSTDGTAEISGLAGATVIRHPRNRGKGAAIQSILNEVKKEIPDVLVLLDADYQHNPDEIPLLINSILEGYDIVIGSRELVRKDIPFYRRIGQRVLTFLTRVLAKNRISDSESGFRAFSKRAIAELELSQKGFAVESEMIAVAEKKRLKVTEVPISVKYTGDGSTLNPIRHGLGVFTQIMVMISEKRPLLFFGVTGGICILVGLWVGIMVVRTLHAAQVMQTGSALLSMLFITVGVLIVSTGLILDVLTRRIGRK